MFEWKNSYSVGIASIDAQHQTLFAIGNELYNAMSTGQARSALNKILERLVQYTKSHFAHEERLMKLHDYPDFAAHKAQHDQLTAQVLQFQAELAGGRVTMSVQVLKFVKDWLVNHIQGTDRRYAPHLISQRVA
jgi:hemerythrin